MTVNNVTILDLETTGLDPEKDEVIEIGAILYSVENQAVLQQVSTLFPVSQNPQEHTNKIKAEATKSFNPFEIEYDYKWLDDMVFQSDYLIAHNADFDKQWLITKGHDYSYRPYEKNWLCTLNDFVWPHNHKPSNLITTALNHGIGVTKAHRALSDCQLIAELFDRTEDLQGLFELAFARANEPRYLVIAQVSFDQKDLAKSAGFHWNPDGKLWTKELRESDICSQQKSWGFEFELEILS